MVLILFGRQNEHHHLLFLAYFDTSRHRLFRFRKRQGQHAIRHAGGDTFAIDRMGKAEASTEVAYIVF